MSWFMPFTKSGTDTSRLVNLGLFDGDQILIPVEGGAQLLKLRRRHLVVDLVGIATLDAIQRCLGQGGLDLQHSLGFGRGLFGRVAQRA